MSFEPVAYTGEDGDKWEILVRKGGKNVLLDWTKDDHKMFSGLLGEVSNQFEAEKPMNQICQNCGLKILHKAVQEWDVDHRYLGGLGTMCQECVKQGDISSSLFPF